MNTTSGKSHYSQRLVQVRWRGTGTTLVLAMLGLLATPALADEPVAANTEEPAAGTITEADTPATGSQTADTASSPAGDSTIKSETENQQEIGDQAVADVVTTLPDQKRTVAAPEKSSSHRDAVKRDKPGKSAGEASTVEAAEEKIPVAAAMPPPPPGPYRVMPHGPGAMTPPAMPMQSGAPQMAPSNLPPPGMAPHQMSPAQMPPWMQGQHPPQRPERHQPDSDENNSAAKDDARTPPANAPRDADMARPWGPPPMPPRYAYGNQMMPPAYGSGPGYPGPGGRGPSGYPNAGSAPNNAPYPGPGNRPMGPGAPGYWGPPRTYGPPPPGPEPWGRDTGPRRYQYGPQTSGPERPNAPDAWGPAPSYGPPPDNWNEQYRMPPPGFADPGRPGGYPPPPQWSGPMEMGPGTGYRGGY